MFVGTFERSLDAKGRLVLPSALRDHLGGRGFVTRLDVCLAVWPPEVFEEKSKRLDAEVQAGRISSNALRMFMADASEVRPDQQGRVTIPERLITTTQLGPDVVIIGRLDRIELWDAAAWSEVADDPAALTAAVTELGL